MKEKILSIFIFAFLLIVIGMTSVNAANISANISGNSSVKVGDTITVRVSFSDSKGVQFLLSYDTSVVEYVTDSTGGSGTTGNSVRIADASLNSNPVAPITITFKAIAEGNANFSISNPVLKDMDGTRITEEVTLSGTSATVKNPAPPEEPDQPSQPDQPNQPAEPTFRNDNSTVYTTTSVNVRSSCSTENRSNILGLLKQGEEIKRTGISNEWDRVTYKGRVAYIRHGYLTTEKPDETDENNEVNETPADDNVIGNVVDNNAVDENTAIENNNVNEENSIVGDNNAIAGTTTGKDKKNGKLIAIVISAAAIVVVGIIMFIIYKKVNDEDEDEEEEVEEKPTPKASKTTGAGNNRTTTTRNTGTKNANTRARSTATKTTGAKKTTTNKTTTGKKQ